MRFRKRLFTGIALLLTVFLALWIISGLSTDPEPGVNEDAYQLGQGAGVTILLCVGLPIIAFFALLAWRNSVGLRNEQRHQEQLEAIKNSK
ncbi:MAG TPA: hypothetical protein PKD09_09475 [Aggregatilinea sp.]|uniref:hypothetical protein n=1 Tax=Aggregatilinea sp. TaxID=2806333 RepID=UPI002D059852|nr:hypothetical protein [Aggregatilinea sp.]HML21867.1 hypothetical protein [Aggregatilinea sp.]